MPETKFRYQVPEFKPPIMTDEERAVAQKKNGKLKASSAGQLFGYLAPSMHCIAGYTYLTI
jgi:hypothetical protein